MFVSIFSYQTVSANKPNKLIDKVKKLFKIENKIENERENEAENEKNEQNIETNPWYSNYHELMKNSAQLSIENYFASTPAYSSSVNLQPWKELGPTVNSAKKYIGKVLFTAFDPQNPNHVFTGSTNCGLWESNDGAETWHNAGTDKLQPTIGVTACAVNPTSSNNWIIGTCTIEGATAGLYRTSDGGSTYQRLNNFANSMASITSNHGYDINKIAFHPTNNNLMYVATSYGLFVTFNLLNSDPTFYPVNPGLLNGELPIHKDFYDIEFMPGNPHIIYASGSLGCEENPSPVISGEQNQAALIWSTDGGSHWRTMPNIAAVTNGTTRISLEVTPANPNVMYALMLKDPDGETLTGSHIADPYPSCDNIPTAKLYRFDYSAINPNSSAWTDKGWIAEKTYNNCVPAPGNYTFNYNPLNTYNWEGIIDHRMNTLCVSKDDANIVFAGDVRAGYITNGLDANVGAWTAIYTYGSSITSLFHDDVQSIKANSDGSIYMANDGGITIRKIQSTPTQNYSSSWLHKNIGLNIADIFGFDVSQQTNSVLSTGNFHCGSAITRGVDWTPFDDYDGCNTSIDKSNDNNIYTSQQNGGIKKQTYNSIANSYSTSSFGISQDWVSFMTVDLDNSGDVFLPYKTCSVVNANNSCIGYHSNVVRRKSNNSNTYIISNFSGTINNVTYGIQNEVPKLFTSKSNPDFLLAYIKDYTYKIRFLYTVDANNTNNSTVTANPQNVATLWNEITPPTLTGYDLVGVEDICVDETDYKKMYVVLQFRNQWWQLDGQLWYYDGNLTTNKWRQIGNNFSTNMILLSSVVKQNNSNTIYVGTHGRGIYVCDFNPSNPSQANWNLYNSNIPFGDIFSLKIQNCTNLLYASINGRGVWATELKKTSALIINSNTIWNTIQKIETDIIIESGYTLTINARLEMSSNTSITVKRGASLIVDGANAIISNGCGARWQGIQVWGNTNLSQTAANAAEFGKVIVRNGGTIENAVDGVTTMKIDAQGNWDWNYTGGIIQCYNATFKNCGRAAQFLGYTNHNASNQEIGTTSYFRATHFILDNNYKSLDWGNPSYQVTIDNSSGINFKKCEFANSNTNITDQNALGSGIYAINSRVNVGAEYYTIGAGGVITPIGRSTFTNMQYGVWTQYPSGSLRNMNVNATDFNNVLGSVTCFTGNKPIVNRCTFTTAGTFFPSANNAIKWGIGLVGAPTFQVEENVFTGSYPTTSNEVGIGVLGSGAATNTIYKNKFKNLTVGFETFGDNRGALAPSGLQFVCNEFNNNKQDNFVGDCFITGLGTCNALGIAFIQGAAATGTTPAISPRNKFISSSPTAEMNLKNVTLSPIVYINSTTPNPLYDLTYYTPTYVNTSAVATSIGGCPSNLNLYKKVLDGKELVKKEIVKIDIDNNDNDITNIKNLLNATVDGGNTQAVIDEIVAAQSQGIQQTVQELLQKSPNLSDDVIYEVAFADDKFTQITQMLILAANPQAGRNLDLMNRLAEKANPMPSIMIDYIVNAATFHSNKEKVESLLADLYHQKNDLHKLQYEYFETDTIGIDTDSLYFYAKNADGPQAIYGIISALINQGLTNEAQAFYAAIPSQFRFTINEDQEYSNYGTLMNTLITIKQNNWELKQLDAAAIQELKSLIETGNLNYATLAATSMLRYIEDKYNETYIHIPYDESNTRHAAKPAKHKPSLEEIIGLYGKPQNGLSIVPFSAYPNPAIESITFTYDFSANINDGKIIISTEAGKVLNTLTMPKNKNKIDVILTNYASGIYLYQVICDDKTFKSDKFTVVK
jgi:hypothetical protein